MRPSSAHQLDNEMTSIQGKVVLGILRNRHMWRGYISKPSMPHDVQAVSAFRAKCEQQASRFGALPKSIALQKEVIQGIYSEWIIPDKAPADKLVFYIHGGGYLSGSCHDHRAIVAKIARKTGIRHFLFDYGLAPEAPYPAAIHDAASVYQHILHCGQEPDKIIFMGESVGGGLCLSLLLYLRDHAIPLPAAAVAISPWTDLSCSADAYHTKNKHSLAPLNSWKVFSDLYVGSNDVMTPYISPLYGQLEGLPPIYINAGECDELIDDSLAFYQKAQQAQLDITLHTHRDMVHCYPLLAPLFPEATYALNDIVHFIHNHL